MKRSELDLLKALFDSYDKNSDGYLSKGEFVSFSREVLEIYSQGSSNTVFKVSDLNHDNKVSFEEFSRISLIEAGKIE